MLSGENDSSSPAALPIATRSTLGFRLTGAVALALGVYQQIETGSAISRHFVEIELIWVVSYRGHFCVASPRFVIVFSQRI